MLVKCILVQGFFKDQTCWVWLWNVNKFLHNLRHFHYFLHWNLKAFGNSKNNSEIFLQCFKLNDCIEIEIKLRFYILHVIRITSFFKFCIQSRNSISLCLYLICNNYSEDVTVQNAEELIFQSKYVLYR